MAPLFDFLGSYWWLVFPLMGVMASVGSAWERGARRRHKRRLEVLHAKAELRAAQRGKILPPTVPIATASAASTAPVATSPVADRQRVSPTQLERLFEAHDAVTARWLEYELDVAKLIAFPAMSDGRQPLTAAFLRAKKVADRLRPPTAKAKLTRDQLAEYRNAVTDFEVAFDVAERDARRVRDSGFSEVERKRLETAKQLLTVAIDQAATPAERQLAYRRVRQELDGLISVSDEAIVLLEEKVALELTSGRGPAPASATPPSAAAPAPAARPAAAPPAPQPAAHPSAAPYPHTGAWPVPARSSDTAPGRVIGPKTHP